MQWFRKHPEVLKRERDGLSHDSNYEESKQVVKNLFLSHGNIVVRLDRTTRHPVLIVYTDATPYRLPQIYPLTEELTDDRVDYFSSLSLGDLQNQIKAHVRYYPELRHQNESGQLCILEWDNLESGGEFYGITTILKRIKQWFTGTITNIFPKDSQAVEYWAHFNKIDRTIFFVYPKEFLNMSLNNGYYYGAVGRKAEFGTSLFFGFLFDGVSNSGLITEVAKAIFPKNELYEHFKTAEDFQTKVALANEKVADGDLIYGIWFHVDKVLTPFNDFNDLITIIGHGNFQSGVNRFTKTAHHFFSTNAPDEFMVGVRYPNQTGVLEFQTFKICKKKHPPAMIFSSKEDERMLSILAQYETVYAIKGEKFTEESYFLRNASRAKKELLDAKSVYMLGVGALGSEISDILAKSGVGNISLIDNQVVSIANPVRHLAGIRYVGVPKVIAVRNILTDHNIFSTISDYPNDLFTPGIVNLFEQSSWAISTTADDNLEGFINEQAVISGRSVFYVRALRGGKVGRIMRVIPGKDACLQCLNLYREENREYITIPGDPNLPTLVNECNNPIRPASASDLKIISSIASRIIIDHLQDENHEENHWIWSTEKIDDTPIKEEYKLHKQFLAPHPRCYYCSPPQLNNVRINANALEDMKRLTMEKKGIETGGVLVGIINDAGDVIILHASEPGPNAIHKRDEFRKDVPFCQEFVNSYFDKSEGKIVYLGEWHSHPSSSIDPSAMDLQSLSEIAIQPEYFTSNPVMVIMSNEGAYSCSVHPAGKHHYHIDLEILPNDDYEPI